MAAAVENATANQRYYCHQCEEHISPTQPELTCPECHLGFIEEINNDEDMDIDEAGHRNDPEHPFSFMMSGRNEIRLGGGRPGRRRRLHMRSRPGMSQDPNIAGHFAALDQLLRLFSSQEPGQTGMPGGESFGGNPGFLNLFHIHGNPGDYAWGGRGLDSIITRLLDQMEGSGPPPADARQIALLPTVKITQEDVDVSLECPVCKDVFNLDEEIKKLPCKHYFHESCITPWLKKHDSCPICRLSLNGTTNDRNDAENDL